MSGARASIGRLLPLAERIAGDLRECPAVVRCDVAGSLRRGAETAKDIDLVAAVTNRITASEAFLAGEWVAGVDARGDTGVTAVAHDGTRVELRMLAPGCYGNLLQHATGSSDHNVALREAAVRKGLKVSEHGIESVETGELETTDDEADVYRRLGLPWIPPELRENRGELRAARNGELPELLELGDIRGDLHMHTDWSDGKASLEQMVDAAIARGHRYVVVTDHSPAVGFGMGLDAGRLRAQVERVRTLAASLEPAFTLLVGCEVDILKDGSLDYSDELLAELDVVVASVHAGHRLSAEDQTRRICAALENPHVDVLGHPTGRMIGVREGRSLDIEQVVQRAVDDGHGAGGLGAAAPARSARHARAARGRGRRQAGGRHRRPLAGGTRLPPLRSGERPPRLGDGGQRGQHPRVARAAQAPQGLTAQPARCSSSSSTSAGPSTTASASASSSAGASFDRTATLTVASRNASTSLRSSPQ